MRFPGEPALPTPLVAGNICTGCIAFVLPAPVCKLVGLPVANADLNALEKTAIINIPDSCALDRLKLSKQNLLVFNPANSSLQGVCLMFQLLRLTRELESL